jgi:precorrin-6B methylase 2
VQGAAPDSFGAIFEDPDSIFFGTADEDVLVAGLDRLGDGGHFVISLTFTGELDRVSAVIDKLGYKFHIVLASVSRGSRGRKGFGLHSLDPYWLIYGSKPGRRSETL